MNSQRVCDLGEQGLLQRLQRYCPSEWVGDDAAIVDVMSSQSLVVTTDLLVDGVHFSDRTTSPVDVGWRATAANLSDLAAMGATPRAITVALGLPAELSVSWVEHLYRGMSDCLRQYGGAIAGGDICRSPVTTIGITALGQVPADLAIRRAVAQPDDAILVTGVHGASRAGLELLLHPEQGQGLEAGDRHSLICAHQRPIPRFDVVALLSQIWGNDPDMPFRVAGMDSSDGLADAVLQICRASQVGARLFRDQIPMPTALQAWISPAQALQWALYGGEDFELVLCLPLAQARMVQQCLGPGAEIVGTIVVTPDVVLSDRSGIYPDEILTLDQGFQHF